MLETLWLSFTAKWCGIIWVIFFKKLCKVNEFKLALIAERSPFSKKYLRAVEIFQPYCPQLWDNQSLKP